jgi:ankyrin repeat protein
MQRLPSNACRAASSGRTEAAKVLVEEGRARVDAKDGQGATPLYVAAATGNQPAALYLLSKGADVEVGLRCVTLSNTCMRTHGPVVPGLLHVEVQGRD